MVANMEPQSELIGRIVGNKVQGLGISNMKGGVAAFMMGGNAFKKSGVTLRQPNLRPEPIHSAGRYLTFTSLRVLGLFVGQVGDPG